MLHHFGSKREIYDLVEQDIFTGLVRKVDAGTGEGSAFERLIGLLDIWLDFMVDRPTAARIIMRNTADLISRPADPVQFSEGVVAQFERIVRAGQTSGDFRTGDPILMLNILGGGIMEYVCNAEQYGALRRYDIAASAAQFRDMIRRTASALVREAV